MDCEICFEDKILKDDIIFFKCNHHICKICYNNLKKRLCPFCRRKIKILKNEQINVKQPEEVVISNEDNDNQDFDNEEDYFAYVRYYNPRVRIKREYKRHIKEKRKMKLQKLLLNETIKNNKYIKIIPNLKVKFQRKLKLFFNTYS